MRLFYGDAEYACELQAKTGKEDLDMIVANNLKEQGAGFETDTNIVTMITPDQIFELELMSKEEVAFHLLDKILELKNKM